MAWAKKLPSGKWQGRYRDNEKHEHSVGTFDHKARAVREASIAEAKARGAYWKSDDARRQTWAKWADEVWWPSRNVAPSTAKGDAHRRANHLDPRWAGVPIAAINRTDVKTWATSLSKNGLSPSSVQKCVALLSASLVAAVDAEVIESNPAARIKLPKAPTDLERFLSRGEFGVLSAHMPTQRDLLIAEMLAYTGLRWGELAGLHRSRVDVRRQMIRVVEVYDSTSGQIKSSPKGKLSRDVPLPAFLAEKISNMRHEGDDCGVKHVSGRCPGPLLISSEMGGPLLNQNWSGRVWRPAVRLAGLGQVRIHDLRHTYASWLLQDGIPLAEVGRLLGHKDSHTTARYAHLAEVPSEAVLAALGSGPAVRMRHAGELTA